MLDIDNLIRQYAGSLCCARFKREILHAVNMRKIRGRKVKILSYQRDENGCFRIIKKVLLGDMVTYYETMVVQWNGRRDVMYLFNVNNVERFLAFG